MKHIYHGKVEGVLVGTEAGCMVTYRREYIELMRGVGIRGDRHAGPRLLDKRECVLLRLGIPQGIQIANHREFSAVSKEELGKIGENLEMSLELPFGYLGENIVVSGIPDFSKLPSGTLLTFSKNAQAKRTAVLAVWRENTACGIVPGEAIRKKYPNVRAEDFPAAARGLRGVVGSVYCSGVVYEGDHVIAILPQYVPGSGAAEEEEEEEH